MGYLDGCRVTECVFASVSLIEWRPLRSSHNDAASRILGNSAFTKLYMFWSARHFFLLVMSRDKDIILAPDTNTSSLSP